MTAQIVDAMSQLYVREGPVAAQLRCVERGLIASICMTCGDVYRVRDARGGVGGLSHGWCSDVCAEICIEPERSRAEPRPARASRRG